jgi:hypothetical protein
MGDDSHPYMGMVVEWSKSGRAKGEKETGKVVKIVPSGMSNKEAVKELREERKDLTILRSYCKVGWDIEDSTRVIVAVPDDADPESYDYSDLPPDGCTFYAPNRLKVRPARPQ